MHTHAHTLADANRYSHMHVQWRAHSHTHAHARTHAYTHTHTGVHKPPRRNLEPSRAGAKTPTRALGEREGSSEVYWRARGRKKERDREQERVRKV